MSPKMKILALNVSTACTGYAIYEDGELCHSCIIRPNKKPKKETMISRIQEIIKKQNPDVVIVQDVFLVLNTKTRNELSEIIEITRNCCMEEGRDFKTLFPAEWIDLIREPGEAFPVTRNNLRPWAHGKAQRFSNKYLSYDVESYAILMGYAYTNQDKLNSKK